MRPARPATRRLAARDANRSDPDAPERNQMATDPLPVTGAWLPGDPVGNRQFHTFATEHPFAV
jgi:hypothetical protein